MSLFKSEELTNAVHASLRVAAALSSGTMVYPHASTVSREQLRAKRGPIPLQWLIERDTFERQIAEQYAQLENGVVRELVAGTGVGKTTVLPFIIARNYQVNGLVLMPDPTYALRTHTHVARRIQQEGGDVSAVILRSAHTISPPAAPVVYFCDADTFLGRLAINPTLIRDLGIDFIFLDESHTGTPGYRFFRYAVAAGIVAGCKVFYGTATASSDMNMESGGVGRAVQKVAPKVLSADNPRAVTSQSPLHYTRIQDRTMVVFATDQEMDMWFQYYDTHDIPTYRCKMATGHRVEVGLDDFLDRYNPCVLLVYGKYRTSVTLNIDTVIDCGYELKAVSDFSTYSVSLKRIPITQALNTQSMGRVGRHKSGRGFYADIEFRFDGDEMDDDTAFYVYLWAKVFNLQINDPSVSQFDGLFSTPLTVVNAAHLLHVRTPPLLMIPYVGDNGFFRGWYTVGSYVTYNHGGKGMYDESPVDTSSWKEYNTGPVAYATTPMVYKSLVQFPKDWSVIPAFAWSVYQGEDPNVALMRTASVISAVPSVRTVRPNNQSRESLNTVSTHDTTLWTGGRTAQASVEDIHRDAPRVTPALRRNSVGSAVPTIPVARQILGVPTMEHVQTAYSVRDTIPPIQPMPVRVHSRNTSVEEVPRDPVELWQQSIGSPPKGQLSRVGSESSDERVQIKLRQVDPVKYKGYKLYPMDPDLFKVFVEQESAVNRDKNRVTKLLNATENIINMRGDITTRKERQGEYFLSTVKVHNAAVVHNAQLAANRSASAIAKMQIFLNGNERSTELDISRTAGLLKAFQLENFYVGIDKRARRSQESDQLFTPDYDLPEARARIMMSFGPANVVQVLHLLTTLSRPLWIDDLYVANAWQMNDLIFTVQHAVEDRLELPVWASCVHAESSDDDVVIYKAKTPIRDTIVFRAGDHGESVYAVAYDKTRYHAVVLGDYYFRQTKTCAYVTVDLAKGASGALIVAASDGAVLGMYGGYFGRVAGEEYSIVVPSDSICKLL